MPTTIETTKTETTKTSREAPAKVSTPKARRPTGLNKAIADYEAYRPTEQRLRATHSAADAASISNPSPEADAAERAAERAWLRANDKLDRLALAILKAKVASPAEALRKIEFYQAHHTAKAKSATFYFKEDLLPAYEEALAQLRSIVEPPPPTGADARIIKASAEAIASDAEVETLREEDFKDEAAYEGACDWAMARALNRMNLMAKSPAKTLAAVQAKARAILERAFLHGRQGEPDFGGIPEGLLVSALRDLVALPLAPPPSLGLPPTGGYWAAFQAKWNTINADLPEAEWLAQIGAIDNAILNAPCTDDEALAAKLRFVHFGASEAGEHKNDVPLLEQVIAALEARATPPAELAALEAELERLWTAEEAPGLTDVEAEARTEATRAVADKIDALPVNSLAAVRLKAKAIAWGWCGVGPAIEHVPGQGTGERLTNCLLAGLLAGYRGPVSQ